MGVVKKEDNKIFIQVSDKWRQIGELEGMQTIVLKIRRNRDSHLMRVWNAYGFAKDVIDRGDWFEYVFIDEEVPLENGNFEKNLYLIPRTDIVLEGRVYETEGFERQYFVPIELLKRYKQ